MFINDGSCVYAPKLHNSGSLFSHGFPCPASRLVLVFSTDHTIIALNYGSADDTVPFQHFYPLLMLSPLVYVLGHAYL